MRCTLDKAVPQKVGIYQHIQNLKFLDRAAFCARAILLTITTLIFFPPVFSLIDTTAAPAPSTTTLTLATSDISVEIAPGNSAGTFVSSGPATISVTTNNYSGYTLGVTSSDNVDNTKLINTSDNTAYLTSISSASAPADFNANNWGYLPSKLNGVANSSYQPAPTTAATTLEATSAANPTANEYTIALGVKANYTLPEGTYENTFTITAVANPVVYTITYNKNTEDMVTNLPETQTGATEAHSIALSSLIPVRTGYEFIGWCASAPTTNTGVDSCDTITYQPGDNVDLDQTSSNDTMLYAMWNKYYTCSAQYRLQNADGTYPSSYTSVGIIAQNLHNGDTCSYASTQSTTYYTNQSNQVTISGQNTIISLDIPRTTYKLTFSNSTYASVSIGTTGNYRWGQSVSIAANHGTGGEFTSWSATAGTIASSTSISTTYTMPASAATITANGQKLYLQNLTSSKCTTTARKAYDSRDNELYTFQKLADGKCWMLDNLAINLANSSTKANLTQTTTNASNTTLNYLKNGGGTTANKYATAGVASWSSGAAGSYTAPLVTVASKNTVPSSAPGGSGNKKVGGYYNFCAASAGSYCYDANAATGNATEDICPVGWRMPTGGSSGEWQTLYGKYGSYAGFRNALSIPLSGNCFNGSVSNHGAEGHFWSSTRQTGNDMATLTLYTSSVTTTDVNYRGNGFTVRCLLK